MQAHELRLGNWVKDGKENIQITVDELKALVNGRAEFDAIPLTPELLEKCGFEKGNEGYYHFSGGKFEYRWHPGGHFYLIVESDWNEIEHLNHLHQLQNLYFALTGEELKIDL